MLRRVVYHGEPFAMTRRSPRGARK